MQQYWTIFAQILTPGLKQNLHHKRGFVVSQVQLESRRIF
jgi:hypothetical protein